MQLYTYQQLSQDNLVRFKALSIVNEVPKLHEDKHSLTQPDRLDTILRENSQQRAESNLRNAPSVRNQRMT